VVSASMRAMRTGLLSPVRTPANSSARCSSRRSVPRPTGVTECRRESRAWARVR
jgi:hypothetical protein